MPRKSPPERAALWLPPLAYMGLIFYLSAQTNPAPELTSRVWDKALHMIEYGALAVLFCRALAGEGIASKSSLVLGLIAASAYGASDEWHQAFVPLRESEVSDWIADTIGAVAGVLAYGVFRAASFAERANKEWLQKR